MDLFDVLANDSVSEKIKIEYRLSVSIPDFETKESASALQMQRQKVVYHMILACVPPEARSAITTALPAKDHTGFAAWKALRAFFIGNEYAYFNPKCCYAIDLLRSIE